MLATYDTLSGSIMDIANNAMSDLTAQSASALEANTGASSGSGSILTDLLDAAKAAAEAEKRKRTILLVGVGVGSLIAGILVGRYAIPKKRR